MTKIKQKIKTYLALRKARWTPDAIQQKALDKANEQAAYWKRKYKTIREQLKQERKK